jgi:hypothetical protein
MDFGCGFCGEPLERAATKHTIANCAYYLKQRAEQAEAERDAARRVIVAAIAQMSKETRACAEEGRAAP